MVLIFEMAGQVIQGDKTALSRRIVLQDLDEFVGTYRGYCQDSLEFKIQFDNCEIAFFIDEIKNLSELMEKLSQIPVGRGIGISPFS